MNNFEKALRLRLQLVELGRLGESLSVQQRKEMVNDQLDVYYGLCSDLFEPEKRLTDEERALIQKVVLATRAV